VKIGSGKGKGKKVIQLFKNILGHKYLVPTLQKVTEALGRQSQTKRDRPYQPFPTYGNYLCCCAAL